MIGPTHAQRRFMDLRRGMFISFGINSCYDVEWSRGDLDPTKFNPDRLDTDAWCAAAKNADLRFLLLTTKHIDGFCLWPSKLTRYGVTSSGCKEDIVERLAESCRKHGLGFAVYYSLWDYTHDHDDASYADFAMSQLEELLTRYGPVVELWFDGAWTKFTRGYRPGADKFTEMWKFGGSMAELQQAWRDQAAPRWRWNEIYRHVKTLQPDCIVLNNSTTDYPGVPLIPVDARTGEKATGAGSVGGAAIDQPVWHWEGRDLYLPLQIETTLSQQGPPGPFAAGSWYWHPWDHTVASAQQVRNWMRHAEAQDAVLVLNCGPKADGTLREEDVRVLGEVAAG